MSTKSKLTSAFISSFSTLGGAIGSLSTKILDAPSSPHVGSSFARQRHALWDDVAYAKRGYRSII